MLYLYNLFEEFDVAGMNTEYWADFLKEAHELGIRDI